MNDIDALTYTQIYAAEHAEDGRPWPDHTPAELIAIAAVADRNYRHAAIEQLMVRATTEGSADATEAAHVLEEYFQSPFTEQMTSNATKAAYFEGRHTRAATYPYLPFIDETETGHDYVLCMLRTKPGRPRFQAYCMVDHTVNGVIKRWGQFQENRRMVMLPAMFELMFRFQTRADGAVDDVLTKAIADGARELHDKYPEAFDTTDTMLCGALTRTLDGTEPPRGYREKRELPTMSNYPARYAALKKLAMA